MANQVLVTGAGGFVGQYLVRTLLKQGKTVYAASYQANSALAKFLPSDQLFPGDLTNYSYTENLIQTVQPEIIYHLAALSVVHTDVAAARRALENNLALQFNLLEATKKYAPRARFLAICSANAYGAVKKEELPISETTPLRPLNAYAVSKLSQEFLSLQYYYSHRLDVVILRPFNHTGPGQTAKFVIPSLAKQFAEIKRGIRQPIIKVGNLDTARDFTDVKDMVAAYLLAAENCAAGEIYNIGSGRASTIGEILNLLSQISGIQVEIKKDESRIRGVDVPILLADASKFKKLTGWQPQVPFRETLKNVLQYWEERV